MKVISQRVRLMASAEVSHLKVKYSKDSSAMIKWTATGTFSGRMVHYMKDSGVVARNLARGSSTGLTVRCMKVISRITSVMGLECCIIHAERGLKDSGRLEKRMVDVSTHGPMGQGMASYISMGRSKERESSRTLWYLLKN